MILNAIGKSIHVDLSKYVYLLLIILFTLLSPVCECINDSLVKEFQNAVHRFDNQYFEVSNRDVSTKAKTYLGRDTISFVVSPLLLELLLMTVSIGATGETFKELQKAMMLNVKEKDKERLISHLINEINSKPNKDFKLETFHMMFANSSIRVTPQYEDVSKRLLNMTFNSLNTTDVISTRIEINKMILQQSHAKMKEIFDDGDFKSTKISIILVSSLYFKNRFLYPPTVLNGTYPFRRPDISELNYTMIRMHRINGVMNYADIPEWSAVVVEVPYITPNISLIVVLPKDIGGLLPMEEAIMKEPNIYQYLEERLKARPVAVTLPKFSLQATVLLPAKIKALGVHKIWGSNAELGGMVEEEGAFISHAVQRIKFWGDQGRGAFKDTGDEELPIPEVIMYADHPFLFIVKMLNVSLMMGHFLV